MGKKRYSSEFKARVVFEVAKGEGTISEIATEYGIHPQASKDVEKRVYRKPASCI